jgi:hypothetical protein
MRVAVAPELKVWLRGWGAEVRVLGPASLRDELVKEARAFIAANEG